MAIIKHRTSKNARYTDVLEYYSYKHQEDSRTGHYEPILDEYGLLQERENYAVAYISAQGTEDDPQLWALACVRTNQAFHKNQSRKDRKSHEYIISHPEEDRPRMTMEDLLNEGKAFVRENLQGYDALIAVHRDTDNDHIHISINSVRACSRGEQPWMMKNEAGLTLPCEINAGGKHQNSPEFRNHCNDWLLTYTRQHGLTEKDNNAIARQRREEHYSGRNRQLKETLLLAASHCHSLEELKTKLYQEHGIRLVLRGKTISLFPPGAKKALRLRTLDVAPEELYRIMGGGKTVSAQDAAILGAGDGQAAAQKKYIQWLRERRLKNTEKAEETISQAEQLIRAQLGDWYNKQDFSDLRFLIRRTTYLERDLTMEAEKLDALWERWQNYLDPALSEEERKRHGNYLRWCGCDPDSQLEYDCIQRERETIAVEKEHTCAIREALIQTAKTWDGVNDLSRLERELSWNSNRETELKKQLESIRASRKKLSRIAHNCQKAADRRIYNKAYLAKAEHFRSLWYEKLQTEQAVKKELKEVRQQRHDAEKAVCTEGKKRPEQGR